MALLAPLGTAPLSTPAPRPAPPSARAAAASRGPSAGVRDGSVDAVRAVLLGVVVVLHSLMAGVGVAADGTPILRNAMEGWDGFAPMTWVAQVMPLFFVLGGFASYTQWTARRTRGVSAGAYVGARMRRLLVPASGAVLATTIVLSSLALAGVPAEVVETAGFRISQPFWFLGVYIGCTALVPAMARLHERHRALTFAALAAGVVAVDVVRAATGEAAVGLLNMAGVWLLMQQLGFALADGSLDRLGRRTLVAVMLLAVAAVGTLMLTGAAPADLIAALNPPMAVLVAMGVAQTALFLLLRPALRAKSSGPRAAAVIGWINARAMSIYAWHMLVVIALAGALLVSPAAPPALLSSDWWLTRPLWCAAVLIGVGLLVRVVGRREAARESAMPALPPVRAAGSALLGATGVVVILATGSHVAGWAMGAALVLAALRVAGAGEPHSAKLAASTGFVAAAALRD